MSGKSTPPGWASIIGGGLRDLFSSIGALFLFFMVARHKIRNMNLTFLW